MAQMDNVMGILGNICGAFAIATPVLSFRLLFPTLALTGAETASDLSVKDRAAVIAAVSVMNDSRASKKEGRCELGEDGWEVTDLKPLPRTSAGLHCEVKVHYFNFKRFYGMSH